MYGPPLTCLYVGGSHPGRAELAARGPLPQNQVKNVLAQIVTFELLHFLPDILIWRASSTACNPSQKHRRTSRLAVR